MAGKKNKVVDSLFKRPLDNDKVLEALLKNVNNFINTKIRVVYIENAIESGLETISCEEGLP